MRATYSTFLKTILFFCIIFFPLYLLLLSPCFSHINSFYVSTSFFNWLNLFVDTQIAKGVLNRLVGLLWGLIVLRLWHTYVDQSNTINTILYSPANKKLQYFSAGFFIQTSIILSALGITFLAGQSTIESPLPDTLSIIVYYLFSSIIIGLNVVLEELVFRGYILQKFAGVFNPAIACMLSALLFMIAHPFHALGLYGVITQAGLMGISVAYIALYYNSIYISCGLHLANNVVMRSLYSAKVGNISSATLYGISLPTFYDILWLSLFTAFFIYNQLWKKTAKSFYIKKS